MALFNFEWEWRPAEGVLCCADLEGTALWTVQVVVYVWLGIFISDEIREIYLQPASLLSQKVDWQTLKSEKKWGYKYISRHTTNHIFLCD